MLKQKNQKLLTIKKYAGLLIITTVLAFNVMLSGWASADQFDEQIKALQQQNFADQQIADQMGAEAATYRDAVNKLDTQINAIRQAILDYQRQSDDLQRQIDREQAELVHQKQVLGESIKTMYLEGQISTLEILASSNDLSEFVDKEEYRNSVQSKIKSTVEKITALKIELEQKQREVQSIIKDKENQQAQLDASLSEQNRLLAFSENQKAAYDQQIKTTNAQISALRAQQLAANRRLGGSVVAGDPNHGGYPAVWDQAPQDSLTDDWGMYNRECVSYTAWKVYQTYGYMPWWGGRGNANQWPSSAATDGIPTGSTPKVGSVAISMGGAYGHSMWVEAVSGNNIYVSQYNFYLDGNYSEMWVDGSSFTYIYFGG